MKRYWRRWAGGTRWLTAAVVAAGACLVNLPAARAEKAPAVTDEQVVTSMQKGIDYLLSVKKGDNWELQEWGGRSTSTMYGGETALVLYALLHAGDSLQDDPDYHSKLNWRGKELGPAVEWLSKITPIETYVAGLQASALTLVPRRAEDKPWEGTAPALAAARNFLMVAMYHQGGYSYGSAAPLSPTGFKTFAEAWEAYCAQGKPAAIKKAIDDYLDAQRQGAGGEIWAMQQLIADLRIRKQAAKTPREAAKADAEMKELQAYSAAMPTDAGYNKELAGAKDGLEKALAAQRAAGTQAEKDKLQAAVDTAKNYVALMQRQGDAKFVPIGDLSNGQYAALGSWAIVDSGMEIPTKYWELTDHYWRAVQSADGAWPYGVGVPGAPSRDTMGVAGIATLSICQEFLDTELRLVPKPDKNMDAGLAWLNKTYKPGSTNFYYLYGVERVGLATGLKFFGTTSWYAEGAANIVHQQKADGSWDGDWGPAVDTAYALLFLARGRNPVCFNKLQYNGPWNARTHDDAYVTRWMSKRFEKPINWQVVNLQVNPEEWLDAPVLLITGSADPKFTKEDVGKLKAYINAGGMIFSTADGASPAFTNAMKKYATEVVDQKYEWRQLPKTHALFSKDMSVSLPNPPPLLGMSNGVREVWIHSAQDVGADWEMRKFSRPSFELGAALYFYASGMGSLRSKLQPLAVHVDSVTPARTIALAHLDYSGNADPEPGAWTRMAKLALANFKTQVNISSVKFADLDAKKYPLAYLTGTTRVTFTAEDAQALKKYLDAGGLLFVDCAGGNAEFAASAKDLFKLVYPEASLTPLAPDHPLYTGKIEGVTDGVKIDSVEFRKYGNLLLKRRVTSPGFESIDVAGRTRILFSQWDVCSGFMGTNTWGIIGYAPASAEALGRNLLLYAQSPRAPAAGK